MKIQSFLNRFPLTADLITHASTIYTLTISFCLFLHFHQWLKFPPETARRKHSSKHITALIDSPRWCESERMNPWQIYQHKILVYGYMTTSRSSVMDRYASQHRKEMDRRQTVIALRDETTLKMETYVGAITPSVLYGTYFLFPLVRCKHCRVQIINVGLERMASGRSCMAGWRMPESQEIICLRYWFARFSLSHEGMLEFAPSPIIFPKYMLSLLLRALHHPIYSFLFFVFNSISSLFLFSHFDFHFTS